MCVDDVIKNKGSTMAATLWNTEFALRKSTASAMPRRMVLLISLLESLRWKDRLYSFQISLVPMKDARISSKYSELINAALLRLYSFNLGDKVLTPEEEEEDDVIHFRNDETSESNEKNYRAISMNKSRIAASVNKRRMINIATTTGDTPTKECSKRNIQTDRGYRTASGNKRRMVAMHKKMEVVGGDDKSAQHEVGIKVSEEMSKTEKKYQELEEVSDYNSILALHVPATLVETHGPVLKGITDAVILLGRLDYMCDTSAPLICVQYQHLDLLSHQHHVKNGIVTLFKQWRSFIKNCKWIFLA